MKVESGEVRKAYMRYVLSYLREHIEILEKKGFYSVDSFLSQEKNIKKFDKGSYKSIYAALRGQTLLPTDKTLEAIEKSFEIPKTFWFFESQIRKDDIECIKYLHLNTTNAAENSTSNANMTDKSSPSNIELENLNEKYPIEETSKILDSPIANFYESKLPFMGITGADFAKDAFEMTFKQYLSRYTLNKKHIARFKKALKEALDTATQKDFKDAEKLRAHIAELNDRQTSLIDKNAKGIIADSILRRQLEQNEDKLMQAHSDLLLLPDKKEDVGELLDFASQYLENPGSVWDKATFRQKLELQWFEFPQGITFQNKNFRTKEIASIFKVKDLFLPCLSSSVRDRGFEPLTLPTSRGCSTN